MREYKEFANKAIPFLTLYEEGDNGPEAIIEFTCGTAFGIYRKMSFPPRPHARNEVANPAFSTTAHVLLELTRPACRSALCRSDGYSAAEPSPLSSCPPGQRTPTGFQMRPGS